MAFFGNGGALAVPIPPLFGVEVLAIPVGREGKIPATPKTTLGFEEAQRGFPGPSPTLLPGRSPGRHPENLHFFLGKTIPSSVPEQMGWVFHLFLGTGNNSPSLSPGTPRASRSTWQRRCRPSESRSALILPLSVSRESQNSSVAH